MLFSSVLVYLQDFSYIKWLNFIFIEKTAIPKLMLLNRKFHFYLSPVVKLPCIDFSANELPNIGWKVEVQWFNRWTLAFDDQSRVVKPSDIHQISMFSGLSTRHWEHFHEYFMWCDNWATWNIPKNFSVQWFDHWILGTCLAIVHCLVIWRMDSENFQEYFSVGWFDHRALKVIRLPF